jgi:redox-sensitive bicupin YhaK (pirin superfamily)
MDVPPHPHIGLSTLTYLFSGEILHRDSLGCVQKILPGEVNWMTAGHGIVHSERIPPSGPDLTLHGLQAWVALPKDDEECAPAFVHASGSDVPLVEGEGVRYRVVAGEALGVSSAVRPHSRLFYVEVTAASGASVRFDPEGRELALYLVEGSARIGGALYSPKRLLVFEKAERLLAQTEGPTRWVLFGGDPLDAPRHMHWNYVSSRRERIEDARTRWREQRFPKIPGETEFVPEP